MGRSKGIGGRYNGRKKNQLSRRKSTSYLRRPTTKDRGGKQGSVAFRPTATKTDNGKKRQRWVGGGRSGQFLGTSRDGKILPVT